VSVTIPQNIMVNFNMMAFVYTHQRSAPVFL